MVAQTEGVKDILLDLRGKKNLSPLQPLATFEWGQAQLQSALASQLLCTLLTSSVIPQCKHGIAAAKPRGLLCRFKDLIRIDQGFCFVLSHLRLGLGDLKVESMAPVNWSILFQKALLWITILHVDWPLCSPLKINCSLTCGQVPKWSIPFSS